ncbi:hypothetical protein PD5205_02944 [Xanthomonas fragariae]|uniref:Uncharacterized protein n=1 Tax=Xanthomonas fragariae TaxID=48664 RepID=A0A1Y6H452_9XANT|nr:hypothetical protein NBC2815_01084 [Xanthomonas fragariae]SMQ98305.1 hypothetical protein PD885_01051 [Xanthomonas fragariae]SMR04231.1 hypothetical protein PD5205_02944 [Xanthomonas fragariae]
MQFSQLTLTDAFNVLFSVDAQREPLLADAP